MAAENIDTTGGQVGVRLTLVDGRVAGLSMDGDPFFDAVDAVKAAQSEIWWELKEMQFRVELPAGSKSHPVVEPAPAQVVTRADVRAGRGCSAADSSRL